MIPGDPAKDATKELTVDQAVAGFRTWLTKHQHDARASFTLEVRDGYLGVETSAVAWYAQQDAEEG